MKIYSYPSIWKMVLRLCMAGVITVFALWIAVPLCFVADNKETIVAFACAGISIALCIRELFMINKKWFIDHNSIRQVCRFQHRELRLKDIKGYRVSNDSIYLVSHKGQRMRISRYVGGCKTLMLWIAANYQNLDFQYG